MSNIKKYPFSSIRGKGNHGTALSAAQLEKLKAFVEGKPSKVAAATEIGIDRNVLDRVIASGSGSKETIEKIISAL